MIRVIRSFRTSFPPSAARALRFCCALPLALITLSAVQGCGDGEDEEVVPIDQIPQDKALASLTDAEQRGLCNWGKEVASSVLPPAGTTLQCGGLTIQVQGTQCLSGKVDAATCDATVLEWRACMPEFFERIALDPCLVLSLQAPGALADFVDETPGCEGLGPCTTTLQ